MKTLILFSLFVTPLFAQNFDVLNQAANGPDPLNCEECADTPDCPQTILKDVLNGNLTFMGRELLPGSDQNRSCVFRGATAYVIYTNCMGNKREAAATDITVLPFTGGKISFYIENGREPRPISTLSRSDYDSSWRVSIEDTPATGQLNMQSLITHLRNTQSPTNRRGCYVGDSFGARNPSATGKCYGGYSNPRWVSAAEKFWVDPGPEWSGTLQRLRQKVISSY